MRCPASPNVGSSSGPVAGDRRGGGKDHRSCDQLLTSDPASITLVEVTLLLQIIIEITADPQVCEYTRICMSKAAEIRYCSVQLRLLALAGVSHGALTAGKLGSLYQLTAGLSLENGSLSAPSVSHPHASPAPHVTVGNA